MKLLTSALDDHYARGTTTLATALRVARTDGTVFAFTTHDQDRTIGTDTYLADPGLVVSEIVIAANADVGNLQLTTLHDGTIFTYGDVFGGKWRNAYFLLFRYDWSEPGALTLDDVDPLLAGTFGEIEIRDSELVVELRDLRQYLQHPIVEVSSKTCRNRLGDAKCGVALSAHTVAGTISEVTDAKRVFRDENRAEPVDYFGEGEITITSGAAEGISAKVRDYAADGTFTLALPLFVDVQVGDDYVAVAGCRKRHEEDCWDKFANGLNFGGEPHRRGMDNVTAAPDPEV